MTVEEVYVNAFDNGLHAWTAVGNSPYLHDTDADYIDRLTSKTAVYDEGAWFFPNSAGSNTINSVKLRFETHRNKLTADDDGVVVYVYDGTSWINAGSIPVTGTSYAWEEIDVSSILNSWAKINGAEVYLETTKAMSVTDVVYVRRCTRKVDYSAGVTYINVAGSIVASGSLLRNKELTISGSTVGVGGLLRDKNFVLQGTIHGTGITSIFKTFAKIEVSGNTITSGSIKVNKKIIINGDVVATGILLTGKTLTVQGLINALGNVTIAEIINDINILGHVLAQGSITVNKTITIQGIIHTLGSVGVVGPPTPTVIPTIPRGFVARRAIQNLITTMDGQVLLDFNSFLMTLDGQIFLNLNGVYVSLDKQVLINLNKNKPAYMIIN